MKKKAHGDRVEFDKEKFFFFFLVTLLVNFETKTQLRCHAC